jgi:hypothetical protein
MEPTRDEIVQGIADGMQSYLNITLGAEAKSILYSGIKIAVQEWLESHKTEIINAIAAYSKQD